MIEDNNLLLNQRKIKNWLRKYSSTINDEKNLRKLILKLFYYDYEGIPISIIKNENDIVWDLFPKLFKDVNREKIVEIYNKEVKSNYFKELKILDEKDLDTYKIQENNFLEISLKTFRPVYKENWKQLSEEVNKISFDKQKSYYALYLNLYLKLHSFPNYYEFINYVYKKYEMPLHRDIKIIFDNIDNSYKDVKEYIIKNDIDYNDVKNIIIKSTKIQNRIQMEK